MAQAGPESCLWIFYKGQKKDDLFLFKVVKLGNVSPGNVIGYIYTLVVTDSLENNADTQRMKVEF